MSGLNSMLQQHTLFLIRNISVSDLLEEVDDYENSLPEHLDEEDADHYQSCLDAILIKSLTGR
jgi:hypothetical protein